MGAMPAKADVSELPGSKLPHRFNVWLIRKFRNSRHVQIARTDSDMEAAPPALPAGSVLLAEVNLHCCFLSIVFF